MTKKSKQYLIALLISDIDDKRSCLRVLRDEHQEARDSRRADVVRDIRVVMNRVERSLRAAEDALEEMIDVEVDEVINKEE